ncbi:unnamed protein product [Ostreobium quekettii]|uniref:Hexosyltransferase n=1 Tax=Ostreobium quekettii TaxID=121088 RepID=A0A8S1IKW7_9CHLO|nr:unnamed protein product [Ostreobium quekettii]|eukprot:evm.model.scf_135.4 EVM.evm.TU.scf_135.4   scf_135:28714-36919(-)
MRPSILPGHVALVLLAASLLFGQGCCRPAWGSSREALEEAPQGSKEAYVTLLYGDDFVLGVRVLGQSIKETETNRCQRLEAMRRPVGASNANGDRVVLVTGDISQTSLKTLASDGWRVKKVETVSNPAKGPHPGGFPKRFWAVYTKLSIFNMVEYERVIYLDADTVVTKNSDVLFSCPGFCATMRHSERLNSGVMVVSPSATMYSDMMSKIESYPSYTGGDQGFLNAYFPDYMNSRVFDPNDTSKDAAAQMMRLPTAFNADIGLYVMNSNRWMIPKENIYIIHFTLATFKPWNWWTPWIIKETKVWQAFRENLPKDSLGYSHGVTATQHFAQFWMVLIPIVMGALLVRRYLWRAGIGSAFHAHPMPGSPRSGGPLVLARSMAPRHFTGLSIVVGYLTILVPLAITFSFVPKHVYPMWGWILAYEWTLFLHFCLFGLYLGWCYRWGKASSSPSSQVHKVSGLANRPWRATLKGAAAGTVALVLCPWLADILLVQSFVVKLMMTIFVGNVATILLTHVYASLPVRWLACGKCEGYTKSEQVI